MPRLIFCLSNVCFLQEMKREKNYDDVIYKRKDEEKMLEDNGYYTSSNKTTRQSRYVTHKSLIQ